jgi:hypothetical protein
VSNELVTAVARARSRLDYASRQLRNEVLFGTSPRSTVARLERDVAGAQLDLRNAEAKLADH